MLLDKAPELAVAFAPLIPNHLAETRVAQARHFDVPLTELPMYVNPSLPSRARDLLADLAGPKDVVLPGLALANLPRVEELFASHEDLAGVDRLRQVIVDAAANGFVHQVLFFVLGDHNYRHVGIGHLDLLQGRKPVQPRHHLVEQHDVKGRLGNKGDGVLAVAHRRHRVAPFVEKEPVSAQ